MLGSKPLEAVLGAGIDNTDHEAVRAFIRQAADLGLQLLFVYPNSKVPADMRSPRQRKADDKACQEAAQEAGRRDWATIKSPAGLALATDNKAVLDRYLKAYIQQFSTWVTAQRNDEGEVCATGEPVQWSKKLEDAGQIVMQTPAAVNLAVEVGGSGVVVVDCDTAAQVRRWFEANDLDPDDPQLPAPTILTPGQTGDGDPNDPATWSHSDGGHFWFTVPDELMPVLPRHIGAMTWGGDNGFAVLWDRRYVLIPPSTRPEGAYEQLGHVYELPEWLAEAIAKAGAYRVQRAEDHRAEDDDLATAVDQWAESVSWASILEPLGAVPAPRADSCGCAVWTAPGPHASRKSATAHDAGCTAGRYTETNAPLHLWTDHDFPPFTDGMDEPGWTPTFSKLQAVALINFGGGVGKAMDALGITPDLSVEPGLDPKGHTADLDMTGDGDFSLPTPVPEPDHMRNDGSWCVPCDTNDGLFVTDPEDGQLWHAIDDDDAAETGGHLASGVVTHPRTSEALEATDEADQATAELAADYDGDQFANVVDAQHYADDLPAALPAPIDPADLPADFGKVRVPKDSPYPDNVDDPDPDVFDSQHTGVPRIAPFSHWRDMPPPEYIIDGLIEHGGLSCIIGSPNAGKSTVALDMACHIATGKRWQGRLTLKTRVLYLPGEGLSGAVQRVRAWEEAHDMAVSADLLMGNGIILVNAQNEAWGEIAAYIARQGIGLVIFDTFARMSAGLEENSATDVGKAVRRFDKLRELTNAGVMVVHHTGKHDPNSGRGSSALNGALDSELLVRPATWDVTQIADDNGRVAGTPIELVTTKQKNAEQLNQPLPLLVTSHDLGEDQFNRRLTAALITAPNGTVDPMEGEPVLARPLPEPIVETAIRVRDFVDRLTQQGATRAEILIAVGPDGYARSRQDTAAYWKQRMAEAVDRGLRYGLIETLTGTASGSRYIPSDNTREQARAAAAAEINDAD